MDDRGSVLYREYRLPIYARCRRLLRSDVDAEDATQEVFLRVVANLRRVPASPEALPWIYRVATNCCLSRLRCAKRAPSLDRVSGEEATSADVERSLVDRDLARKIMAGVPDDMQASVWLRHVDGMSHQEV